jgi:hypothetical protein
VGKWLGDGCMFVGTEVRPVVETGLDLTERMENASIVLPLRIGIAAGPGDRVRGRRLHRDVDQPRVAAVRRRRAGRDPRQRRSGACSRDAFPVIPLGERQIPGIVTPIPVWRIAAPEMEDDELPLSFAE